MLEDNKINEIEQTVRDEFEHILKSDEYDVFDYIDKMYIYGLYGGRVNRFRFMPGERALINKMVMHINSFKVDALNAGMEENLEQTFRSDHFSIPPRTKISRKETCRTEIGYLFGKKTEVVPTSNNSTPMNSKESLLEKCNSLLKPFDLTLKEEQIKIVNDGARVFACVSCSLCEMKEITIQCDVSKNSLKSYWNLSNFNKHLKKHKNEAISTNTDLIKDNKKKSSPKVKKENIPSDRTEKVSNKRTNQPLQTQNSNINQIEDATNLEEDFVGLVESNDSTIMIHNEDSLTDSIYQQISVQNLKLTTAIMSHNKTIEDMEFQLNSSRCVNLIRMNGDGSCLFSASAHQIYLHKVNSKQHKGQKNYVEM